jgi:hypothetical protein
VRAALPARGGKKGIRINRLNFHDSPSGEQQKQRDIRAGVYADPMMNMCS